MKFRLVFALLLAPLVSGVVYGDGKQALAMNYQKDDMTERYLAVAQAAFLVANSQLKLKGRLPLFCVPSKLPLNAGNAVGIFERELARYQAKGSDEDPMWSKIQLEDVLLLGLLRTFPCGD